MLLANMHLPKDKPRSSGRSLQNTEAHQLMGVPRPLGEPLYVTGFTMRIAFSETDFGLAALNALTAGMQEAHADTAGPGTTR